DDGRLTRPEVTARLLCALRGGGGVPVGRTDVHDESSNGAGVCRPCACGLISGSVKYDPEPLEPAAAGKLLICCSPPGRRGNRHLARTPNLKARNGVLA